MLVTYMFHSEFPQCPVGLLLLRTSGDQHLSVKASLAVCRPVLFTLSLVKGNIQKTKLSSLSFNVSVVTIIDLYQLFVGPKNP